MSTQLADSFVNEQAAHFLTRDPWQDWTPTVTQLGAVTVTVNYARYVVLAQTVVVQARLTVTGSGTAGNAIVIAGIPSPIASANINTYAIIGSALVVTSIHYHGALVANGADDWRIIIDGSSNFLGISPSIALANNHQISLQATYERA